MRSKTYVEDLPMKCGKKCVKMAGLNLSVLSYD